MRAVAAFGLMPIPGPVDELVLILIAPVLLLYREPLKDAWAKSLSSAALPASAAAD